MTGVDFFFFIKSVDVKNEYFKTKYKDNCFGCNCGCIYEFHNDLSRLKFWLYFLVSSSDALFLFTFVHTSKLEKSIFNHFFPFTISFCAHDVIFHSI